MSQLSFFGPQLWSVTDITQYLQDLLSGDDQLQDLWVQGEVSNLTRPNSGHMYFSIKDASATIKCVMWRNAVTRLGYIPREGDAVEVHGAINIYQASGQYQLYADVIQPTGEGQLYQEFTRLKARLEAEGLFAPERKRPIPRWPHTIGIVTSPTGAALRDMLNTLRRRYPLVQVVLAPTLVQGTEAPLTIVAALQNLCRVCEPDVVLVARGGGSIEDLWAFNDERVARAIAAAPVPVISGVGHETDFTIADFVSDLRAPTPTAAAELATPNLDDLQRSLSALSVRLGRATQSILNTQRWELNRVENRLLQRSPQAQVRSDRQRLDDLSRRAGVAVAHNLRLTRARLTGIEQRLAALNPLAVLQRGYAVVQRADGQVVRRRGEVQPGDLLQVRLSDGRLTTRVENIEPE